MIGKYFVIEKERTILFPYVAIIYINGTFFSCNVFMTKFMAKRWAKKQVMK